MIKTSHYTMSLARNRKIILEIPDGMNQDDFDFMILWINQLGLVKESKEEIPIKEEKPNNKKTTNEKPVSLAPLKFKEALSALLQTKPEEKSKPIEVPEKRTRKGNEKYTQEQIINELREAKNILEVSRNLGCTRTTIYQYIKKYPAIKVANEEAKKRRKKKGVRPGHQAGVFNVAAWVKEKKRKSILTNRSRQD